MGYLRTGGLDNHQSTQQALHRVSSVILTPTSSMHSKPIG